MLLTSAPASIPANLDMSPAVVYLFVVVVSLISSASSTTTHVCPLTLVTSFEFQDFSHIVQLHTTQSQTLKSIFQLHRF